MKLILFRTVTSTFALEGSRCRAIKMNLKQSSFFPKQSGINSRTDLLRKEQVSKFHLYQNQNQKKKWKFQNHIDESQKQN